MRAAGTIYRTDGGEYVLAWGGQWINGVYRSRVQARAAMLAFRIFGWEPSR